MTQEEKELLFQDLSARLPYKPWVWFRENYETNPNFKGCQSQLRLYHLEYIVKDMDITLKPYLRPMSSMTKEERKEWSGEVLMSPDTVFSDKMDVLYDFCNSHHLDYRGLIEKGLANEAPDGMYKI